MKRVAFAFGLFFFQVSAVFAASGDAPSCSDPAMFPNRIPNYLIASCKTANDVQLFRWPGGQEEVMGIRTEVVYKVPTPELGATPKYIASNYANAVRGIGGELRDDPARSTLGDRLTARLEIDSREVWVHLTSDAPVIGGNWLTYKVIVVQKDAAAQVITAQKMLDALNADGFMTLHLNFETAKWDIKPDDLGTVDQIAELMRANPQLQLSVEGHTDNVGTPEANKVLSANRARAVMDAVVARGVSPERLTSTGFGQENPIADNRTEAGRAQNRRVELVKK
ncbi:MAG: OmpA family protein [Xanthomonadales bacterium]|nr:OmpA family protein [Xanthomonadales bacterium]